MSFTNPSYSSGANTVGSRVSAFVLSIDGKYAYMVNSGPDSTNQLSAYNRDRDTGALTQLGVSLPLSSQCQSILAVHPTGQWLLVKDFPNLLVYQINADGSLSSAPVSQASAPHILSLQLPSYGNFVYTLRYLSGDGPNPTWIDCYSFDAGTGTITAHPSLTVSGPANAYDLNIPEGGDFAVVVAGFNPSAIQVGMVYLYVLDSETGAIGNCVDQIASHTKRPLSILSQGPFFYVLENEVVSFANVPTQFCLSAYRILPAENKIHELGDSPYQTVLPPAVGAINAKRLYLLGATGYLSEAPRAAFYYRIDSSSGRLTASDTEIPLSHSPQLIAVDATERSLYLSSVHAVGQGMESSFDIYNTPFPYLTCDVTPGLQTTALASQINSPQGVSVAVAAAGFYYGTDPSPDTSDNSVAGVLNGSAFSASLATSLFTPGTRYYVRAFVTTTDGETFLGDVQPFAITFPLVFSFSQSPIGIGAQLTITGQFFSATPSENSIVFANAVAAPASSATPTSLVLTVPPGAASGPVFVIVGNVQGPPSAQPLQIQPVPVISRFSPSIAGLGAPITLYGSGFNNPIVSFAGVAPGSVQSVSPDGSSLVVLVPSQAQSGPLTVSCNGVPSAPSALPFTLQLQPSITALSASVAATGTTLTVTGTQFSPTGLNQVVFPTASSPIAVTANSVTATTLQVVIPPSAISGKISVVCNGVANAAFATSLSILQVAAAGLPEGYYAAACNATGTVVSIRNAGNVYVSTDSGLTWSGALSLPKQFSLTGLRLTDVFHYAGQFYIAGYTSRTSGNGATTNSGYVFSSSNGTSWKMTPDMPALLSAVCSSGSGLLGVRNYSPTANTPGKEFLTYFGTGALELRSGNRIGNLNIQGSCFGNATFLLLPDSNQLITLNQNGSSPQTITAPTGGSFPTRGFSHACWSPLLNQFVAVGSTSWSSKDGVAWGPFSALPTFANTGDTPSRIASSPKYLVLGTRTGCIYASADGASWFPVIQNAQGNGVQIVGTIPCGNAFLIFNNQSEVFLLTPA